MAPKLELSEDAIRWLNQSEQQIDDSDGRRRKRNVLYNFDTSVVHRFRRQAPGDQRVEVNRELDQETGVEIYVQVFLDHGEEARNETLEVIVNLPTFQPADINKEPDRYMHNETIKIMVSFYSFASQKKGTRQSEASVVRFNNS